MDAKKVECKQQKRSCRFYGKGGKCSILENTQFTRECPFYKPKEREHKYIQVNYCGTCPYYDRTLHKPDGINCKAELEGEFTDPYYLDCKLPKLT